MLINFDRGVVQLTRRQDIELVDGVGIAITCISGSVWITQERDNADIVLGPCGSFVLDRPGIAIVHALAASTLRLVQPVRAISARARSAGPPRHPGGRPGWSPPKETAAKV